jgi:hypothetical protein
MAILATMNVRMDVDVVEDAAVALGDGIARAAVALGAANIDVAVLGVATTMAILATMNVRMDVDVVEDAAVALGDGIARAAVALGAANIDVAVLGVGHLKFPYLGCEI